MSYLAGGGPACYNGPMSTPEKASWRQRRRFMIHLTAMLVVVIAPFLLYTALQSGAAALAALWFALIAAAFAAVTWVG
ncbi:MAG TPA: hypothetical protein VFF68_00280 [Anaerolineaceae bacterium]|nr:hypothetical protein [Anaerolineaceae bacterium]